MTTNDHERIIKLWKQIHAAGLKLYLEDSETLEMKFSDELDELQSLAYQLYECLKRV